jgi:CPA2 family monovalent cation:H+ antiporter-2
MEHYPLIPTLVAGIVGAFIFGFIAKRLKLPSILGYMVAGILIGPHTPGYIASVEIATQLSEIGVILLMFGVGLHFSLKDLLSVRKIAIPGAIVQVMVGVTLGLGCALMAGFSVVEGLAFGFALSVASTIVAIRSLESRGRLQTDIGKLTVGWLIVEDIITVLVIVLLPVIATLAAKEGTANLESIAYKLGFTLVKVSAFAALMMIAGRRLLPPLLVAIAKTKSRELSSLGTLAIALGFAFAAYTLFDASFALGAFLAGFVLNESEIGHKAAENSLPLRDTFAVLFFVSVGMLFDPTVILRAPITILIALAVIAAGTSGVTFLLVRGMGKSLRTSAMVAASLAQIGEFSFIFAGMARQLELMSPHLYDVILASALLSIALNPFLLRWVDEKLVPEKAAA